MLRVVGWDIGSGGYVAGLNSVGWVCCVDRGDDRGETSVCTEGEMRLDDIGFYTLSDERAKTASASTSLQRCELILTDVCNFHCPYCRGIVPKYSGTLSYTEAYNTVTLWIAEGLKNIRFSGGEPTLYPRLLDLCQYCNDNGVDRIAISTNGSASIDVYQGLITAGVTDFSVSLDACCASTADIMAGTKGVYDRVLDNIRFLSSRVYTTVGVVLTERNAKEIQEIINTATELGVSDIRIISSAQWNAPVSLNQTHTKYPILKYRTENNIQGRNMRGIQDSDTTGCPLVLDDMVIAAGFHFPCIIYFREGGRPIGNVGRGMRDDRAYWFENHNTHEDVICRKNCLDVCVDYNNKWAEYHAA